MNIGEIWLHKSYYFEDGRWLPKYFVILGFWNGDIVLRTLTSRPHLRSHDVCSHDSTKPHYSLGVVNPEAGLGAHSWVDLLHDDDIEYTSWKTLVAQQTISLVMSLPVAVMCPLLQCAIGAPDTTNNQIKSLYDSRSKLSC